jgi:hypothetical protein
MTNKPFDKFNKRVFQELLSPFGQVFPEFGILGEGRRIDVFFAPYPGVVTDVSELGYLAEMTRQPALLEPFRSALLDKHVHECMMKLFMVFADLEREHPTVPVTGMPQLWILAAEVSDRLLNDFAEQPGNDLMEGLYPLRKGLGTTIVAISELPVVPETLWLRLLGKGVTQEMAISDLLMMPESDPKRGLTLDLLVSWGINMEVTEQFELEERRIIMALSQVYMEWKKQTEALGEARGEERAKRSAIEGLLRARFGGVDQELAAVVPRLMSLESDEYTRLLLNLSRSELLVLL